MTETLPSNEPKLVTLPPTWKQAKLGDFLTMEYGKGLPKAKRNAEGNVPVYGSSGIAGYHDQSLNSNPCLIVGRKGSAGSVHLSNEPCWTIDTAYSIEPPNGIDLAYLYYLLRTAGLDSLDKSTAVPSLSRDDAYSVSVAIAPTKEQRRIVEKIEELFTKLDAGVRSLEQAWAQLKSYRRSVLKAAVEGELSREWREAHRDEIEPASELLERILQERREKFAGKKYKEPTSPDALEHSTLPEGWEWASLEQLSWDSGYGTSSKCGYDFSGPPVLRIPNISRARVNLEDIKFADSQANLKQEGKVAVGDLLIIRTNGSRDLIGRAAVVKQSLETDHFFASYLIRYRLAGGEPVYSWVETIWHSQGIRSWMQATAATSAGQYNISVGALNKLLIPLPSQEEMKIISEEVERCLSVVDKLEATVEENLKQANALRQSILKRAFSGELVPQDPDDEPASALLERIGAEREATKPKAGKGRTKAIPAKRVHAEQGGLF